MFGPGSRYFGLEIAKRVEPHGKEVTFVRRRLVPQPEKFAPLHDHVVKQGERLDQIAFANLGDAEQFWRLCDANRVMRPEALTETAGRRLIVTLPENIPGPRRG
jgi:hypothetical protein